MPKDSGKFANILSNHLKGQMERENGNGPSDEVL